PEALWHEGGPIPHEDEKHGYGHREEHQLPQPEQPPQGETQEGHHERPARHEASTKPESHDGSAIAPDHGGRRPTSVCSSSACPVKRPVKRRLTCSDIGPLPRALCWSKCTPGTSSTPRKVVRARNSPTGSSKKASLYSTWICSLGSRS